MLVDVAGPGQPGDTSAELVAVVEAAHAQIVHLREGFGMTWPQIAKLTGYSKGHAKRVYYQWRARQAREYEAEDARLLVHARLCERMDDVRAILNGELIELAQKKMDTSPIYIPRNPDRVFIGIIDEMMDLWDLKLPRGR